MLPYYSFSNLLFFSIGISLLFLIIPLIVHFKEYNRRLSILGTLIFTAALMITLPVSRICPYKTIKIILYALNYFCITGALIFGIFSLIKKTYRSNTYSEKEAHRWIMESLKGRYIITDARDRVLSFGPTILNTADPKNQETLQESLQNSAKNSIGNNKAITDFASEIYDKKNTQGNLEISGKYYRWTYKELNDFKIQGNILLFTDLTEEHQLLNEIQKQGKLLELKNRQLTEHGESAVSLKRSQLLHELSEKITYTISIHLKELMKELKILSDSEDTTESDINKRIQKSKETMSEIRKAVHMLPYKTKKDKT